jgi:hypothetical protein
VLSASEKREIWSRWKAGESLHDIGAKCCVDRLSRPRQWDLRSPSLLGDRCVIALPPHASIGVHPHCKLCQ